MSGPIAAQSKPAATQAGTVTQHASIAPPDDYVPLTAEGLLLFCQARLQEFDTDIQKKMNGQKGLVGLQKSIGELQSMLKAGDGKANGNDKVAFDNSDVVKAVDAKITELINEAKANGNEDLAKTLKGVSTELRTGGDNMVTKDEIKEMCTTLDNALASVRSGAELSMIDLQSLVSKRATTLQLTTGMMNSINEGQKSIAANIGRG